MNELVQSIAVYFQQYGYWTLAAALLLENAGVPVPGETILLVAGVLAETRHSLSLPVIIAVGTAAATLGDNLGFLIGRWGGRPLLERSARFFRHPPSLIARGERLFGRYGASAVFVGRFVFGLRVLAGPLAGVLRMRWKRFLVFNALGALTWVSVVSSAGYLFGRQLPALLGSARILSLVLLVAIVTTFVLLRKRIAARLDEEA